MLQSPALRPLLLTVLVLVLLSSGLAAVATADARKTPARRARARTAATALRARSQSLGLPWQGRLRNGALLRPSADLRLRRASTHFYGTAELVQLIERASRHVSATVPGSRLVVGELSQRNGGEIDGHHSHENGRDADIAFYMLDAAGNPFTSTRYLDVLPDGSIAGAPAGVHFDTARNWQLIASMLEAEPEASVQYAFCSTEVSALLLAEAQRVAAAPELVARAAMVLVQPQNSNPHRDHFHVRIYCPPTSTAQCRDVSPRWPTLAQLRRRPGPVPWIRDS